MKNYLLLFILLIGLPLFAFTKIDTESYLDIESSLDAEPYLDAEPSLYTEPSLDAEPSIQEMLLQMALNTQIVENALAKQRDANNPELIFVTNNLIDEDSHLTLSEQQLNMVSSLEEAHLLSKDLVLLELKALNIKSTKAAFLFNLGEYKIKVKLQNTQGEWQYSSSQSRKKGHYSIDSEF